MTDSAKRTTYHHGSLRTALIDAAEAIIREKGLENFSLREATRRAGVSPGAPKHHFGNVSGLFAAVATKGFERQATYMAAVPVTENLAADLRGLVIAYLAFANDNAELYRLMFRTTLLQEDAALGVAQIASLERTARLMAVYEGVPITDESETVVAPAVIASIGTMHGLALLALESRRGNEDRRIAEYLMLGASVADIVTARWPDKR